MLFFIKVLHTVAALISHCREEQVVYGVQIRFEVRVSGAASKCPELQEAVAGAQRVSLRSVDGETS